MFAIIKTGGKQYKIKENDTIFVEKLKNKKGDKIDIKDVLLLSNDEKNIKIGTPYLKGVSIKAEVLENSLNKYVKQDEKIIYLSPKGTKYTQEMAKSFLKEKTTNIICGHFEGVDQRVLETRNIEEVSIGDFILSGGETAAYVFIDAIVRLLPGVLGNNQSTLEESFENNLLEYPQYTKPQMWESKSVPDVLLSGDHAKIKDWRLSQSEAITRRRRPDLWEKYKNNNKK